MVLFTALELKTNECWWNISHSTLPREGDVSKETTAKRFPQSADRGVTGVKIKS